MAKVLIFSDIHIHPHKKKSERLEDCLKALEWVFKEASKREIEDIIFAGDLFHDRQKIDVLTYQRTFELFEKYINPNLRIHLLLGNHDLWYSDKWDVSSVFPLRSIAGVSVIDKPCSKMISGMEWSFLPYTHDPSTDVQKIKNKSKYKILIGHVAVNGAIYNVMHNTHAEVEIEHDGDMIKVDSGVFTGWDQVFLGHYHAQQKLDYNVEYIGSPLQLSFGEAFQHKHIIIFDTETHEKEYVRNKFSPQHFIIPESDINKYDLNNNFIIILAEDIAKNEIVELRQNILQNNSIGSLQIKPIEKKQKETLVEDAKAILFKGNEMLESYIKSKMPIADLDEGILLKIGKKIIESSNVA